MEKDCLEWKLTAVDPQERRTWRAGVRFATRAASQLPGRDPLMWMMPHHLHVNQKSDYDDDKQHMRFWYSLYCWAMEVKVSLCKYTDSPERLGVAEGSGQNLDF